MVVVKLQALHVDLPIFLICVLYSDVSSVTLFSYTLFSSRMTRCSIGDDFVANNLLERIDLTPSLRTLCIWYSGLCKISYTVLNNLYLQQTVSNSFSLFNCLSFMSLDRDFSAFV